MENSNRKKAFSLLEITIIISILVIISAISFPIFISLDRRYKLDNSADLLIDKIRLAKEKTVASEGDARYGIYFDRAANPDRCILFRGSSFSLRDQAFDGVYDLPDAVELFSINLSGSNEVVFNKKTGSVDVSGDISLRLVSDTAKTRSIYISSLGQIGFNPLPTSSDLERIKDSRHVHFQYSRAIDSSEIITLNFNGGLTTQILAIADILEGGNLSWQGKIDVNGNAQEISIQTRDGLNNPTTEFCVRRDMRYNNEPLAITISGDVSGSLAEYSADGLSVNSTSIYVDNLDRK